MINTNETLKKYDLKLTKTLGQNFLTDINIIRKIVDAGEVTDKDLVIEIGPGIGAMTVVLSERAGKVVAVEIDKNLIPALKENLAHCTNLEIIHADIMKVDIPSLVSGWDGPLKVISNLPYYITTPIVMMLLESDIPFDMLVFMVQKEVAQRMAAAPSTKDYGALTIAVNYYADPKLCFTVSKNCFIPKPDVDSAVVRLKKRVHASTVEVSKQAFFRVVRSAFSMRRKTLLNSLGSQPWLSGGKEGLKAIMGEAGLPESIRAEELTLEQFVNLTRCIEKHQSL